MPVKTGTIIASIAAALAIGAGGYFASERATCSSLEQDYLATTAAIKRDSATDLRMASIGSAGPNEELKAARDLRLKVLERQLSAIYDQCGTPAGEAVSRKASDNLIGS